jgi:hypothetical protein
MLQKIASLIFPEEPQEVEEIGGGRLDGYGDMRIENLRRMVVLRKRGLLKMPLKSTKLQELTALAVGKNDTLAIYLLRKEALYKKVSQK